MPNKVVIAGVFMLAVAVQPAHAQLPPSVGASRVRGSTRLLTENLNDDDRQARCAELKALVAMLKPDVGTSPLKAREVADFDRMRAALACPDMGGPLQGTWKITGTSQMAGEAPVAGMLILKVIERDAALKLAAEANWGMASSRICRDAPDGTFFYSGTVTWDKGSLLNDARSMWDNSGPATVILCAASPESTQARGNVRDNRGAYGATIQWDSLAGGQIFPDTESGPVAELYGEKVKLER